VHVPADPSVDLVQRSSADTEGDVQRLLGRLEESGNAQKVVRLLANSSTIFKPFVLMSTALMAKATLPATEREVVILYLAARRGVAYEWAEHIPMSAAAGITEAQRDVLATGALDDLQLFTDGQQLALRAAQEITEEGRLSEASWDQARSSWGEQGAIDLVCTVGWWGGFVPTIIEAFGLQTPR
jgi:hypothetical protein